MVQQKSTFNSPMRRVVTCLFVVILGLSGAPIAHAQQIKVMQWNIRGHLGWSFSNNTAEAKAIARIVNYNRPDILLFCELQDISQLDDTFGLIGWVTNNVPYLGSVPSSYAGAPPNATFWVSIATKSDGFIRNGAISRYPISDDTTYSDGLRGLHRFRVQLAGTNVLEVFHAHLKCCATSSSDCNTRQTESETDATNIVNWAAANSIPYIMAGDWNEDESHPECTITSSYHPVTTLREGAHLVEFKPSALNGDSDTESTPNPTSRIDYCLAASNRLSAVSGYVFNSAVWVLPQYGLYTNGNPSNLSSDSHTASDHCSVFVDYVFPVAPNIVGIVPTNNDILITWMTGVGKTNALQVTSGGAGGGYSNNFTDLVVLTNTVGIVTNYLDAGAATSSTPSRYYRLRQAP